MQYAHAVQDVVVGTLSVSTATKPRTGMISKTRWGLRLMNLMSSHRTVSNCDQIDARSTPSVLLTPSAAASNEDRNPAQDNGVARDSTTLPASVSSAWSNKQTGYLGASSAINFVSGPRTELPLSDREHSEVSLPVQYTLVFKLISRASCSRALLLMTSTRLS